MGDTIKVAAAQVLRPGCYQVERDTIIIGPYGKIGIVKAGCVLEMPEPDGPLVVTTEQK